MARQGLEFHYRAWSGPGAVCSGLLYQWVSRQEGAPCLRQELSLSEQEQREAKAGPCSMSPAGLRSSQALDEPESKVLRRA